MPSLILGTYIRDCWHSIVDFTVSDVADILNVFVNVMRITR